MSKPLEVKSANKTKVALLGPLTGCFVAAFITCGCSGGGGGGGPAVPPSGPQVVFQSNRDGDFEITRMSPSGDNPTRVTDNTALDVEPSQSRDRSKIVFRSTRHGNPEIYVISASGTDRLTNNTFDDDQPSFSPDGSKIVFRSIRNGRFQIMLMNANGTGETNLTAAAPFDTAFNSDPDFAPNGDIVFSSNPSPDSASFRIFRMKPDGSGVLPLTAGPADSRPAVSPDGSRLIYESRSSGNSEIFIMNTSGGAAVNLTKNGASDNDPVFSPDGHQIFFASTRTGNFEIFVMDDRGGNPTNISNNPAVDRLPDVR